MKIVAVVSGKGGVGKTFVTCNAGVILALAGFKTIVIDADVDLANIELVYGVEAKATLQDLVDGSAKPSDVRLFPSKNGCPQVIPLKIIAAFQKMDLS